MIKSISSTMNLSRSLCCIKKCESIVNIPMLKHVPPEKDIYVKGTADLFAEKIEPLKVEINEIGINELTAEKHSYTKTFRDEIFPEEYVCKDLNCITRLKPHIYIKMIEVKPEYARQGICSKIEQKIIEMAKNNEFEGRVVLNSAKIEAPDMTQIPSPSLVHWKNGFRFADKNNNEIMEKVMSGELPLEDAPEGTMYYPLN